MKTLILFIFLVCVIAGVICLVLQLDVPEQFWLWIVGLAGPFLAIIQFIFQQVRKLLTDEERFAQGDEKPMRTL
jgi:hypothetical protein